MDDHTLHVSDVRQDELEKRIQVSDEHQIYLEYHRSEIDHNEKIIRHSLYLIWFGAALLTAAFIVSIITGKIQITAVASGAFVELFSGGMVFLANKSSDSKQQYFNSISRAENEQKMIDLVSDIDNQETKTKLIEKMIEGHYRR